jgi:oligoribonuclease
VLAWLDLEMTGLDPTRNSIVEIATLVTDDQLEIVAEGPDLVLSAPPAELEAMEAVVRDMHTRSGLLEAIKASGTSLAEAELATLRFLRTHLEAGAVPLCGNSIGTDRRFLAAQMPDLERFFHYRSVDVSTIKELCRRWYPGALSDAPTKKGGHRAMDDIRESVAELAYYRRTVFRDPPPTP